MSSDTRQSMSPVERVRRRVWDATAPIASTGSLIVSRRSFLHNHQILHARTAYEDYPEPERRRHLLRLWLSPPNGRPWPAVFAERYGSVEVGQRGGIRVPGTELVTPLEAEVGVG